MEAQESARSRLTERVRLWILAHRGRQLRGNREAKGGASRGWWAATFGFILTIAGVGVVVYDAFVVHPGTIPLDTTVFAGAGILGLGIALAAIGIEQGKPGYA